MIVLDNNKLTLLLTFESIHQALAAEKAFQEDGFEHDLIPVPRNISSDCQMALRIPPAQLQIVSGYLAKSRFTVRAVYEYQEGYAKKILP